MRCHLLQNANRERQVSRSLKKKDDEGESTMIRRRSSLGVTHTDARGPPKSVALPREEHDFARARRRASVLPAAVGPAPARRACGGAGTNQVRASARAAESARVLGKREILEQAQKDGRLLSWSEGATEIANDPNFGAFELSAKFASLWRPADEVGGSSSEDREQIGVFVRPKGGGVVTRVVTFVITGQCKVQTCATATTEASEDPLTFGHAILAYAGAPGLLPTAVLGREAAVEFGSKFDIDIVLNTLGVLPPAKISGESNETTDNFVAFFSVLLTTMSPGTGYNILCANHNETCDAGFTIATAINDAGRRTYSFKKNCGGGGVAAYKLALPHMLENVRTRAAALADGAVGDEIYHLSFSGRMTFFIKNGTSKQILLGSNQVMGAKLPHVGYLKQVSSSGMPNLTSLADALACIDGMDALRTVQAVIRWWAENDPNWVGCNITAVDAATTTADACAIAALAAGAPNGRGFTPAQCAAGGAASSQAQLDAGTHMSQVRNAGGQLACIQAQLDAGKHISQNTAAIAASNTARTGEKRHEKLSVQQERLLDPKGSGPFTTAETAAFKTGVLGPCGTDVVSLQQFVPTRPQKQLYDKVRNMLNGTSGCSKMELAVANRIRQVGKASTLQRKVAEATYKAAVIKKQTTQAAAEKKSKKALKKALPEQLE
jgi:hypothetical protein